MLFQAKQCDWLVGLTLVMATAIKPQMGLFFLLYALCGLRWQTWAWAAIAGVTLWAIGVGQLWIHHIDWVSSLQEGYRQTLQPGGLNDPTPANPSTHLMLNLQYPLNMLIPHPAVANILALAFAAIMAGFALWAQRRNKDRRGTTLTYAIIAVLSLLAVYHRCYDAVLLLLPLAWAFMSLETPDRRLAILAIIFMLPFLVPGPIALAVMAEAGRIPHSISGTWWWRLLIMPHQVYALLLLAICLVCAAWKNRPSALSGVTS